MIEKDENDSLSIEHKEEIRIFHRYMDLLTSKVLNPSSDYFPYHLTLTQ